LTFTNNSVTDKLFGDDLSKKLEEYRNPRKLICLDLMMTNHLVVAIQALKAGILILIILRSGKDSEEVIF